MTQEPIEVSKGPVILGIRNKTSVQRIPLFFIHLLLPFRGKELKNKVSLWLENKISHGKNRAQPYVTLRGSEVMKAKTKHSFRSVLIIYL